MVKESDKVFGNDGEFFHVQVDPMASSEGFRDSGYYDGSLDNKLAAPDLKLVKSQMLSDTETEQIIQEIQSKHAAVFGGNTKKKRKQIVPEMSGEVEKQDTRSESKRPTSLPPIELNESQQIAGNAPGGVTSPSDSEYVSGQESLSDDSSPGAATPDIESSVDTGEVFNTHSPTQEVAAPPPTHRNHGKNNSEVESEQAAENCVIS